MDMKCRESLHSEDFSVLLTFAKYHLFSVWFLVVGIGLWWCFVYSMSST